MPSAHRAARTSGPPQRVAAAQPAPTLVGRGAELATLSAALSEADAGHGRTVFVVGESGIGKTHLVNTLADQAAWRGFTVAVGRAYPVERGVPYSVFSDALLPVLRGIEPSVLTLLSRGGTAELAQLFPALGTGGERSSAARGDPTELKARLLWNFSQFLSRFAAKRPLLLDAREPPVGRQRVARDAALRRATDLRRSHSARRHAQRSRASRQSGASSDRSVAAQSRQRAARATRAAGRGRDHRDSRAPVRGAAGARARLRRAPASLDGRQSLLHRRDDQGVGRRRPAAIDAGRLGGVGRRGASRAVDDPRGRACPIRAICRRTRGRWRTSPRCSACARRTTSWRP